MVLRLAALLTLLTARAWAGGFPADVPLPALAKVNPSTLSEHNYDQLANPLAPARTRGHHVRAWLSYVPEGSSPAAQAVWDAWKPLLVKAGWKPVKDDGTAHLLTKGAGTLVIGLGDNQDPLVEMITGASKPATLKLAPPAAKPEAVKDTQDYPWLPAFPGAKLESTGTSSVPMIVTLPGDKDAQVVGATQVVKSYTPPATLSKLETELAFTGALAAAGWDVLPGTEGEGIVTAHFTRSGRNIWLAIGRAADDSNTGLRYSIADVGSDDWAKQLDAECKVQLVGVRFDFDKATLKPESAPVLAKAAALIKSRPALRLELSGHTDNIGAAPYNEKLSQQRAEAVVAWLVEHGVAKAKLVATGYGMAQPIADNSSEVGRAQNRRVQLGCVK
jgi:OmpA-OmpF porin, OOP family